MASESSAEEGFLSPGGAVSREGSRGFTLSEAEKHWPHEVLEGKKHFVSLLPEESQLLELFPERPVLRALADAISGGRATALFGQSVQLEDIEAAGGSVCSLPSSGSFKIIRPLGSGDFHVDVVVQPEDGDAEYALRFFASSENTSLLSAEVGSAFEGEFNGATKALGGRSAVEGMEESGFAGPLYAASIRGIDASTKLHGVSVYPRVLLYSLFRGNLENILYQLGDLPPNSKEYVARRLVTLVLLLQKAGVAHNNLEFKNFFVRSDGSIFVGNFSAAVFFGEKIQRHLLGLNPAFAPPELLLAVSKEDNGTGVMDGENEFIAKPAGDMWSLGAMLFSFFTKGNTPYDLLGDPEIGIYYDTVLKELFERNAQPDQLKRFLEIFSVPGQWIQLMMRLLTLKSGDRMTGEQLLVSFPELSGVSVSK
uniref:ROP38 n=1 Tax=Eimeria stiedai TaxID=471275 RepID=A0A9E8ABZ9_9EIME|nr:ROP38 [Eimeria stiedai]